ncbi:mRNA splicing protein prp28 [Coemansia sp. Benny D115]|nr:mRNA splicing protein prp28 [Coemansia sp. Benny D115]
MDFSSSKRGRRDQASGQESDGEVEESSAYVNPFAASGASKTNTKTMHTETKASSEPQPHIADILKRARQSKKPLSVEEALRLKTQTSEPERPVFLTKAQRAQRALEKKQQAADQVRQQRQAEIDAFNRMQTSDSDLDPGSDGRHSRPSRGRSPDHRHRRSRRRNDSRTRRRDASRSRSPDAHRPSGDSHVLVGKATTDGTGDRVLTESEREAIRERYRPSGEAPSRRRGGGGGRRVVFDWAGDEDTSRDISDLYEQRSYPASTRAWQLDRGADDRHWSDKSLGEMRERDWRIFREDFGISCKGGDLPRPYRSWRESNIPDELLRCIASIGYAEPTPIQRQTIPVGLQGRDLIGLAETGSGKTAAFLVPMLARILRHDLTRLQAQDGPLALVLAPTRELALQIEGEAAKFGRRLGVRCVAVVGGHDVEAQAAALRRGAEIVVATPGRLRDSLERRVLLLGQCTHVVMDEADRMIDRGFEEDVNFILDALPPSTDAADAADADADAADAGNPGRRLTAMFSATMPPAVERLARRYLRRPATVTIGTVGKAVDTVEQRVEFITGDERRRQRLLALLSQHARGRRTIVFVNQKKTADLLASALSDSRHSVATLHGGKTQEQREHALGRLRTGEVDVLVATDVAGRGIDVKDVALVINYDMAKDIESYTHRIGRTGRAGSHGLAITFVNLVEDRDVLYDLRRMLMSSPLSKCPQELATNENAQAPPALAKSMAAGAARKPR